MSQTNDMYVYDVFLDIWEKINPELKNIHGKKLREQKLLMNFNVIDHELRSSMAHEI